jgi:Mrp family chromosome partitioning ATPase
MYGDEERGTSLPRLMSRLLRGHGTMQIDHREHLERSVTASPAIDAIPGVPLPPTRLVGRDHDIEALITLLTDSSTRLLTVTGPGGVGKTHLSLSLAALLAPRFSNGVIFVPLASVRDPNMVLPEIARALGVREGSDQSLIETLGSALSRQDALILLDNMEQVLEAVPDIGVLIAATARPRFLVTSRSLLRLRVEREYPLPPSYSRSALSKTPTFHRTMR